MNKMQVPQTEQTEQPEEVVAVDQKVNDEEKLEDFITPN